MKMSDTREIQADQAIVYTALQDPEVLKACIAGATELAGSPQQGYEATVVQKVGPVKATFKGHVVMSEMIEDTSMKLTGEGKGGIAGFAKGAGQCGAGGRPRWRDAHLLRGRSQSRRQTGATWQPPDRWLCEENG